jgi:hypothetical protein
MALTFQYKSYDGLTARPDVAAVGGALSTKELASAPASPHFVAPTAEQLLNTKLPPAAAFKDATALIAVPVESTAL